jgi:hypothetical protein
MIENPLLKIPPGIISLQNIPPANLQIDPDLIVHSGDTHDGIIHAS